VELVLELCSGGDMLQLMQSRRGRHTLGASAVRVAAPGLSHGPAAGTLAEPEAAAVVAAVAAALSGCHSVGLAHGDIKPENVLLAAGGPVTAASVRLADFSAALPLGSVSGQSAGAVADYIAPEAAAALRAGPQALVPPVAAAMPGRAGACTAGRAGGGVPAAASSSSSSPLREAPPGAGTFSSGPADVWSLGCLGVTLLSGSSPFCFGAASRAAGQGRYLSKASDDDEIDASLSASLSESFVGLIGGDADEHPSRLLRRLRQAWAMPTAEAEAAASSEVRAFVKSATAGRPSDAAISDDAASALARMLHPSPAARPSAAEACSLPWLSGLLRPCPGRTAVFVAEGAAVRDPAAAVAALTCAIAALQEPRAGAAGRSPTASLVSAFGRALTLEASGLPPDEEEEDDDLEGNPDDEEPPADSVPASPMRGSSGRKRSVSLREAKSPPQPMRRGLHTAERQARPGGPLLGTFPSLPVAAAGAAASRAGAAVQPSLSSSSSAATAPVGPPPGAAAGLGSTFSESDVLQGFPSLSSPQSTTSDNDSVGVGRSLSRGPGSPAPKRPTRGMPE